MKKLLVLIVLPVLIIMSLVFASYVVFMQFHPEREVRRMMFNMASLEGVNYDSGFSWSRENSERVSSTLYASGQVTLSPLGGVDQQSKFRVVHLSEEEDYTDLSGEILTIDGMTYLTYNPPGPEVTGIEFDKPDTWVSFETGEFDTWGALLPGLNAPIETVTPSGTWDPDAIDRLRILFALTDVIYVDYSGETEYINSMPTRILDGRFDRDAVHGFLLDLVRAKEAREPEDSERILAAQLADQLERLTVRLWIGSDDQLLYRLQAAGGFEEIDSTDLIPVDLRIDFSGFSSQFESKPPEYTIAFSSVLERAIALLPESAAALLTGLESSGELVKADSRLPVTEIPKFSDPDGDGLDSILEFFYGTDPKNADTDGDGVSDGDEVRSGDNPRGSGSLFGFGL